MLGGLLGLGEIGRNVFAQLGAPLERDFLNKVVRTVGVKTLAQTWPICLEVCGTGWAHMSLAG